MSRTGSETVAEGDQSFEEEDEEEASGELRASQASRSSMGFLLASIATTRKKTLKKPVKATPVKELPCVVELCRAVNVPQMVRSSKSTGNSGGGGDRRAAASSASQGTDNDADDPGGTNPFVTMKIVPSKCGGEQRSKGVQRRWPYKSNTLFPVTLFGLRDLLLCALYDLVSWLCV